ncbi:unnamed protein product [Acanthoscelides obtectus]|uniref:Tubulin--tyrosine ligase-like protein 5 n=2 Tax=Acanthoscelides obtectus TaxID=200917 RepID=A0A9P0P890_ACAOB|nr:unnamed protein product [Acanthoscelides obtectus]CAK1670285.1 Tubulin polyglutamylase TTLL5 [Acanthoscelides obtectus]
MDAVVDRAAVIPHHKEKKEVENKSLKASLCSWGSLNTLLDEKRVAEPAAKDSLDAIFDPNERDESDSIETVDDITGASLLSAPLGSNNAVLLFRSSALAESNEYLIREKPAFKLHITYKVLQAETKLLSKLLDCHGICEVAPNSSDFNLLWTGSHPKPGTLRSLGPHQRVNHFPRSYELTRKDRLYKNIERMQQLKGFKNFDFIPQTFVMPIEYRDLCTAHHRSRGPWIVKPVASSRGRGIFIVETPAQVPLEEPVVVAKYISNPLLVAGHKCDLRLYVVVTSFDPLLVYIYEEGLVRFATVRYDASRKQLWNPCMHLCNYSINKYHSDYVKSDDPSAENVGHKWTLSALLRHLKSEGKDTTMLMSQIEDLVIKAILASANAIVAACRMFVPHSSVCFELYGFDILIDSTLKPWLLEVNLSPSLNCDSPLDVRLKSAMLADLLSLIGIPAVNPMMKQIPSRPSTNTSVSLKMKFPNCRQVHSAENLHNMHSSVGGPRFSSTSGVQSAASSIPQLNGEEARIVKMATSQFKRRGGFIRIFPAVDSWSRYSQYLDTQTGIPTSGGSSSNYINNNTRNYNLLLFRYLFPEDYSSACDKKFNKSPLRPIYPHMEQHKPNVAVQVEGRQDRYERMLRQGHRQFIIPCKMSNESHTVEMKKKILEMLKCGKRISQSEARKTFSHYLMRILRRIAQMPEQEDHVDVVLKFLQKASNYLRTPFNVKTPSSKMSIKDKTAIVAKQLNDFLYLYNRETDLFVDKTEKPSQIPAKLYNEFVEHAIESDLEEVLIYQTSLTTPIQSTGIKGMVKCIPRSGKNAYASSRWPSKPKVKATTAR